MRELACIVLGAVLVIFLATWVSRHRPHSAALAWRVLDGAARLPLFESDEPQEEPHEMLREAVRPELRVGPREALLEPAPQPVAKPRKRLTALMKKKIAARDFWRCQICKRLVTHTFEIDHIQPQSQGGSHAESNLRTLCRECHGIVTADQRLK